MKFAYTCPYCTALLSWTVPLTICPVCNATPIPSDLLQPPLPNRQTAEVQWKEKREEEREYRSDLN